MGMQRTRKIHKGQATCVVQSKLKLRTFAIYTDLANLTKHRSVHNYKERLPALANTLKISIPTLKKYLTLLLKYKWAREEGKHLCMTGRRRVAKMMGVSYKDYWVIQTGTFKDLELHFRALAIEENRRSQHHSINEKIIKREVKKAKIICKDIAKKFAKTVDVPSAKARLRAVNILSEINTEVTLGRKGIANLYNLTTARSGSYWMNKMKGIMKDERQEPKWLGKMDRKYFYALQQKSRRYIYLQGGIPFARLPNQVGYLRLQSI